MIAKNTRNLIAGFLGACGSLAFATAIYVDHSWAVAAPGVADPAHGLIYLRNVDDHPGYWSAFQTTSAALLFYFPIPVWMLAAVVMLKKNRRSIGKGPLSEVLWDPDDPRQLRWWGAAVGAAFTALLFWRLGPALVETLNAHAIVLNV